MITRLMAAPPGATGYWATLEDGTVYHMVHDDSADLNRALFDWLDTNDIEVEPYQEPEPIVFVESPVDSVNAALADAGFDITVTTDEEAADAQAFLEVHSRTQLEEAAARFAQQNQIVIE